MTLARLALLISLLALLGAAGAVEIEILEADRLEQVQEVVGDPDEDYAPDGT